MVTQTVDIQKNLSQLYTKWKSYTANERTGYINFLTEFLACFGINFDNPNDLPFEKNTGKGFADLYIKDTVIIEMKDKNKIKSREELKEQLPQALRYWEGTGKHVPFLVLSNFNEFIIFDTRDSTSHFLRLADLENKVESFNFLLRLNPVFAPEQEAVTRKSAKLMGKFYRSLKGRQKGHLEDVDTFVLQCLFCLFSEDIGYLPVQTFTNCVRRIMDGEDNSANILSTLFKMMDERDSERKKGRFENVRYFNGPLFRKKPEIVLNDEEIGYLWESCQLDWKNVRPEIFGALFESSQTKVDRHKDGMHFTSEEDILKVIKPCILDQWNEVFSKCKTASEYKEAHRKLKSYRVLDPACGSGNFLVVAYRELKALEARIFMEYRLLSGETYTQAQESLGWFPVTNMYGIELNPFPAFLTQVSLWITKKLARNQFKLTEQDLPLEELKHIIAADALEVKWDDVDVVVGNPPYIGCKMIRSARGDEYFEWLGTRFKNHNKMSDYCTYWFEKVLEDVRPGVLVGLVCTKTISQNQSREASLDKVIAFGGQIFNAVSKEKWSGEAQVTVSIVNFVNKDTYSGSKTLDGKKVTSINSSLKSGEDFISISKINEGEKSAFVGVAIQGIGFVVSEEERKLYLKSDSRNKEVIKPYLMGDDLNQTSDCKPSRWIIDFADMPLEKAKTFKLPFQHVLKNVKPHRDKVRRDAHKKYWWQYGDKRMEMRAKIAPLKRYIATSCVSKYVLFQFMEKEVLPSHSCTVIAKDDYGTLGVLNSIFHVAWAWDTSSTLETRIRYNNSVTYETFPFPKQISNDIGKIMEDVDRYRKTACLQQSIGLTTLYNEMEDGGHTLLRKLHERLDISVAKNYGFTTDEIRSRSKIIDFLRAENRARTGTFELKPKKAIGDIESTFNAGKKNGRLTAVPAAQMPTKTGFDKTLEKRLALANIITTALSEDKNFGRTKFAKIFYVCDEESSLELKTEYTREAAGPLDQRALYNEKIGLEALGEKHGLFKAIQSGKKGEKVKYALGPQAKAFLKPAEKLVGSSSDIIKKVISIFAPLDTEQSEIVATLYACWKDLLLSSKVATVDAVINEFRNKWHPKKKRFDPERLRIAIDWMKKKGLVPTATGKMTKIKDSKLLADEEIPF